MTSRTLPSASTTESAPRSRFFRYRPDQQWEAYLFILPSFIGFFIFVFLAIAISLGLSFSDWGLTGWKGFVGFKNYQALWRDPVFWKTFRNTIFYIATIVPMQLALGLLMAMLLNQGLRGRVFYRVIYFMPVVTTIVAGAIIFRLLLSSNGPIADLVYGFANLTGLPIQPPDWLNSTKNSKWAVVMLTLWKNTGFTMVIYLAALQGVPQLLYDAAETDGASPWQRFRHVTLPMISPTTFFLVVWQMIGAFQLFTEPFVMTRGGPANSSMPVVQYIYQNAFEFGRMGKAAAIAWFLFLFIFAATLIQNRLQNRWVYYETE
jgi:multiple sugar transport system permease protein